MRRHQLSPGELFAGRYLVERQLGQGAMGTVHLVVDQREPVAPLHPRIVALKVMSLHLLGTPEFAERFQREAKIGASIRSEHVVRVHESGVDASTAFPYFTMDLLEGEDLHRRLDKEPDLEPDFARQLLRELFDAIGAAHAANIVHRDLKPENLFLVRRADGGRADGGSGSTSLKVLDFGVAKVVREITGARTRAGLGSPLWVAPEQGKEGQAIKPSSDVWALGLLAYRLLAGEIYWRAASADGASAFDLAVEMLRAPIVAPSVRSAEIGARDLGLAFDRWFLRAVDRDPAKRYANAGEAFGELRPILERAPDPVPAPDVGARSMPPAALAASAEAPAPITGVLGWLKRLVGGG